MQKNMMEQKLSESGKKELEQRKAEYLKVEAPEELKERLEQMAKERKHKKSKNKVLWFGTRIAGGMAAAMLTMVVAVNSSQDIAMAMQNIPAIGAIAKVITFRTYENTTEGFEAKVEVPEIKEDNSEAAKEVNKTINEYVNSLIKEHEDAICSSKAYQDEYGEALTNRQSLDTQYKVLTDSDRLLSIRLDTTILMAGSDTFSQIFHIDKLNDQRITLKDLFKKESDYVTIISNNIKQQMRDRMKEDDSVSYFIDSEFSDWDFQKIKKNQNFYVDKNHQLVLVFDKYEAAPGYMGQVEFTIDSSLLADKFSDLGNAILQ